MTYAELVHYLANKCGALDVKPGYARTYGKETARQEIDEILTRAIVGDE